jgi:hypothetical protein
VEKPIWKNRSGKTDLEKPIWKNRSEIPISLNRPGHFTDRAVQADPILPSGTN